MIAAYRSYGATYLRQARALAAPRKMGRPRKGEVRTPQLDRHDARKKALRHARYWYATAARVVLVNREKVA